MKSLLSIAVASALLVSGCSQEDSSNTETTQEKATTETPASVADKSTTDFSIPYEKYTLDNGLKIILHRDTSDPIVALSTVFHVGSNREVPGKTGFAHFFEHMAFNNSENVPMGANRKMIGELGGTRNGGTWTDGTIYYEVVPKDAFEKLLWIDSDRLGYMINTVTEDALEREKQVVKNEKRQRVDNRPYGHTDGVIKSNLYPKNHPYNWSVIGSLEDLQNATLDDVKEFYSDFYGPNNATLVIAGDIDIAKTKVLVEQWFGEIKRGKDVPKMEPRPAVLEKTISLVHEDNFAKLPEIRMVFPTVEQYHKDSYALNVLAEVLSDGRRAPLFREIVETQKLASRVSAFNSSREIAGEFGFAVRAKAGTDLNTVKAAIEKGLATFEAEGFSEKELQMIKARQETSFYNGISSVLNKAFSLGNYNEYAGDPGYISKDIAAIKAVTKADVIDVYNRYVKDQHYVMTSFVPKGQLDLAVTGAVDAGVVEEAIIQGAEKEVAVKDESELKFEKTPSKFSRTEPELSEPAVFSLPPIWDDSLANGARVLGIVHDELPLVQMSIRINGGHSIEDPKKSGTARILAELMMQGTRNKTPEQLEDAIGLLGSGISVNAGAEEISISMNTLKSNYNETLTLVEEIITQPRFDEVEFKRIKQKLLTGLKQSDGDADAIASRVANKLIYGEDHILSISTNGTLATVESITLDDVKALYKKAITPAMAAIHIAGDIDQKETIQSLASLNKQWTGGKSDIPTYETKAANAQPQLYFVDVAGAKQSVLIAGHSLFPGGHDDYNNLVFSNDRLGAGSGARLTQLLRIQKGYTYGAYSRVQSRASASAFIARTSVRANVTKESMELLLNELMTYKDTFTADDLATTKNIVTKRQTRQFETIGSLLGVLNSISKYDLPLDFLTRNQKEVEALTLNDVHATIEQYMNPKTMNFLVVGDADTQLERLKDLGLGEPIILDINGNPVK